MKACIIGSFRKHYDDILKIIDLFECNNIQVLSPKKSSILDEEAEFVIFESDNPAFSNAEIQLEVFKNISKSDFVYVWNPDGYVGKTVCYEIGAIHGMGRIKDLYYKEMPKEDIIYAPDKAIISKEDLVQYIKVNNALPSENFRNSEPDRLDKTI